MRWALAVLAVPVVYVAVRDLRLNFRTDPADVWRGVAHSRARAASIAGAVTAPLLYPASAVLAVVFAVASVALFWLVPNRTLSTAPKSKPTRKRGRS